MGPFQGMLVLQARYEMSGLGKLAFGLLQPRETSFCEILGRFGCLCYSLKWALLGRLLYFSAGC